MSACPQCLGTDCQDICAQGQCYCEEQQREMEREERQREEMREMERHYQEHPHG